MRSLRKSKGPTPVATPGQNPAFTCTAFLVSNLHCLSCVTSIQQALTTLFPHTILFVSPNIVTSVVTVEHITNPADSSYKSATVSAIIEALEDAGFEVEAIQTGDEASRRPERADPARRQSFVDSMTGPGYLPSRPPTPRRRAAHLENCAACQKGKEHTDEKLCYEVVHQDSNKETATESGDAEAEMMGVTSAEPREASWKVVLAVGGMTCAVCVNTITNELKKREFIEDVSVVLVTNSATVIISDISHKEDVIGTIEDLGYDTAIDSVEKLQAAPTIMTATQKDSAPAQRVIDVRVDGMFCPHCPSRLTHAFSGFSSSCLQILQTPTIERAILQVAYTPDAPTFTVRHIIKAVEAADPAFTASIYHPPTLEERSKEIVKKHQRELAVRTIFAAVVAIPTFVLGIVYMNLIPSSNHAKMYLMNPFTSGINRLQIILFALATPVYFFGADIFHMRTIKEIRALWRPGSRTPIFQRFYRFGSMNMLVSLGTTIAYVSSIAQMIDAGVKKIHMVDDTQFYFDSVVFLTLFLLLGRLIESYSKSRTGDAVEMLGKLRPATAILVNESGDISNDTTIPVDLLDLGDTVRVPHGSSPPADGTVLSGTTSFDESSLTGEARLVPKAPGDSVFAGTINKDGVILMTVTGASGGSMLDQIIKVVREGQAKRAPMEQIADMLTMYFVPVIVLIAISTWLIWMILGYAGVIPNSWLDHRNGWVAFSLQFAVAVFVVACPCGLALAAPTAIFVGGGLAAQNGILAKGGGEAFQKASKIDCVVFDKTGTLTEGGEPKVTDELVEESVDLGIWAAVKAVEGNSSHPVARAISKYCDEKPTIPVEVQDLSEIPGRGMKATVLTNGTPSTLLIGNESLLITHSVVIPPSVSETLTSWKKAAKSVALVAISSSPDSPFVLALSLSIADSLRPETPSVIRILQSSGTPVFILSGDSRLAALAVAKSLGIPDDNVIAEVLPSQKADKIAYLQTTLPRGSGPSGRAIVAMVGDGINDSPALTQSDVAVAIGSGSDIAVSTADFVLVTSDLQAVCTLVQLSKAVFRRIKFNFGWACIFNLVAVPIAAGVLYPVMVNGKHVRLDPVWAALAMACSSVSVVMGSLSLRSGWWGVGFRVKKAE